MIPLWKRLRREERLVLAAIHAFGRTTRDEGVNCRWVLAEALRQARHWTAEVRESLSEYGYVEKPDPKVVKFDAALIGLARCPRDGNVLVEGMGNFGSPNGDYLAAHPMWRQCALTKEGQALLKQALPDLPLVGSELTSAIRKLGERKARLVASAACRQMANWVVAPLPADALVAIENYADTWQTKTALRRWRQSLRGQIERVQILEAERARTHRAEAEHIVSICLGQEPIEPDESEEDRLANETACVIRGLAAIESAATENRYFSTADRVAYVFAVRSFGCPGHVCMAQGSSETMLGVRKAIHGIYLDVSGPKRPTKFNTRWRTQEVFELATTMYQSRDYSALPMLGDSLKDAGCDSQEIIAHCHQPAEHVIGCWLVDLILGKS